MVKPRTRVAPEAPEAAPAPDGNGGRGRPAGRRAGAEGAATPADRIAVPVPGEGEAHDLARPEYYLNRELTWLNFNFRVLCEAEDERTPLLERVKFLAIVSGNLDEFVMKRIGGLKQQVGAGLADRTIDGRTPQEQIDEAYELIRRLEERKLACYATLKRELEGAGIVLTTFDAVDEARREKLRVHFLRNIFPLLTPQGTDPTHPFPFISNLSINLLVTLRYPNERFSSLARVKVPAGTQVPRLLQVDGERTFVTLESVMAGNLDLLFPGMVIESCEQFRVTRNANTELDEERANDLLAVIETGLRERKFAPIVRLEVAEGMLPQHRGMLAAELGLDEHAEVFEVRGPLNMGGLLELCSIDEPSLHDAPHRPVDHPALVTSRQIFHTIRDAGSLLLHHPYEAFTTSVERLLREASRDPKVRAVKMTLYRTSAESKAVEYLIDAARNGKQVAVVVELKARFDEEANIRWASRLEDVGIHVTYGVVGLKTHCKVILIVRQDFNGLRRYVHIGTGNYHAGTARLYTDLGLLTSDDEIGEDVTELFNYLTTGYKPKRNYKKLFPAPKLMMPALLAKIEREARNHTEKSPGLIRLKLNALEDPKVTRALYEAAGVGVRLDLIVRDTCRLRPGIPGLTENVRVVSVVGRFLEHARIYHFRNGGDEEYFIGSADAMGRNLLSRVEVLVPVEGRNLRRELDYILDTQIEDHRSGWEMRSDGSYVQRRPIEGRRVRSSQEAFIERAERRMWEATRLKRRTPRGIRLRNVR